LLAIAKPRLAQQLVPFRLVVERNVEQAASPVRTGRGASLRQEPQQGSDARSGSTTVLERVKQASLEGREGAASDVLRARGTRALRRASFDARSGGSTRPPLRGVERMGRKRPGALLARRTRTMKRCSFDARSKGQPWPLLLREG